MIRCPLLSNWCTFVLTNQQDGKYITATELELIRFWPFPLHDLVWHLSTQVKDSDIAAYITVFDRSKDNCRRFIPFLVYNVVYTSIASNIVTLANLSPWSDFVYTYTFPPLLSKSLLR